MLRVGFAVVQVGIETLGDAFEVSKPLRIAVAVREGADEDLVNEIVGGIFSAGGTFNSEIGNAADQQYEGDPTI
jgi:hypothetical protein